MEHVQQEVGHVEHVTQDVEHDTGPTAEYVQQEVGHEHAMEDVEQHTEPTMEHVRTQEVDNADQQTEYASEHVEQGVGDVEQKIEDGEKEAKGAEQAFGNVEHDAEDEAASEDEGLEEAKLKKGSGDKKKGKKKQEKVENVQGSSSSASKYAPALAESAVADAGPAQIFRKRWKKADEESWGQNICRNVESDYEFCGLLGSGRFARVFLARHRKNGENVALKLHSMRRLAQRTSELTQLATDDSKPERTRVRTKRVIRHCKSIRHERLLLCCLSGLSNFIVGILKKPFTIVSDLEAGELGYPMECLHRNLAQAWSDWFQTLKGADAHDVDRTMHEAAVFVAAQLAEAVRFLHTCGIIHRNIKPRSIMFGRDGYVKLVNFSIAFLDSAVRGLRLPSSVSGVTDSHMMQAHQNGPPEDVWCYLVQAENRVGYARDFIRNLVEIGHASDLHMMGMCISSLDWPVSPDSKPYDLVLYDFRRSKTFTKFLTKYQVATLPARIHGSLLDYIRQLTAASPSQRLGFDNPEHLIQHYVFKHIDFQLLTMVLVDQGEVFLCWPVVSCPTPVLGNI